MTEGTPARAARAFQRHDAVSDDEGSHRVTSTAFDAIVSGVAVDGTIRYQVTVTAPSLEAATSDPVGEAVASGWFETFERRLADAPKATRASLDLERLEVERRGLDVVVTFGFDWDDPDRAVEIAKTLVEYVEGTYVEGAIPGYSYESPVADLLSAAETGGDGERGGTPL
jgi:hypothetical protein